MDADIVKSIRATLVLENSSLLGFGGEGTWYVFCSAQCVKGRRRVFRDR